MSRSLNLWLGGLLSLAVVVMAMLSWLWTPWPPQAMNLNNTLAPMSMAHWLGTDVYGRDIFSMLLVGARSSIAVGLLAVGLGCGVGVALGLWAAAQGGWIDEGLSRLADVSMAFPAILTAIVFTTLWGPGMINAMLAIGLANIPIFLRIARAAARGVWVREFILAARAAGLGPVAITLRHILPNIAALIIIQATVQFSLAILAEAALSYLGLGTQPPQPSWGRMLAEAQTLIFEAPSLALAPGLAIILTVLGLNLLGDGLRDVLDPHIAPDRP